jgi:hypothetical protein
MIFLNEHLNLMLIITLIFYLLFVTFFYLLLISVFLFLLLIYLCLILAYLTQRLILFIIMLNQILFDFDFFVIMTSNITIYSYDVVYLHVSFLVAYLEFIEVFTYELNLLIIVLFQIFNTFNLSTLLQYHYYFLRNLLLHI